MNQGCLNNLLLTTHSQQVSTAYGITSFGLELLLLRRCEFTDIINKLDSMLYRDRYGEPLTPETLTELENVSALNAAPTSTSATHGNAAATLMTASRMPSCVVNASEEYLMRTRYLEKVGEFCLCNKFGFAFTSLSTFVEVRPKARARCPPARPPALRFILPRTKTIDRCTDRITDRLTSFRTHS